MHEYIIHSITMCPVPQDTYLVRCYWDGNTTEVEALRVFALKTTLRDVYRKPKEPAFCFISGGPRGHEEWINAGYVYLGQDTLHEYVTEGNGYEAFILDEEVCSGDRVFLKMCGGGELFEVKQEAVAWADKRRAQRERQSRLVAEAS